MAIDLSDEILQDFLVEAGEILELLGEQLVELEQAPDDYELLNAIFRGFHTIKGGAGFLNLTAMVSICHLAEDVFNILRQGERSVEPLLMDVILKVIDVVNVMFAEVRSGEYPTPADPQLIEQLKPFSVAAGSVAETGNDAQAREESDHSGERPAEQEIESVTDGHAAVASSELDGAEAGLAMASDEITEEEFDALLDSLQADKASPGPASSAPKTAASEITPSAASDEITEDEFEALLDQLHGTGPVKTVTASAPARTVTVGDDEISEDEFETLLDELHGKGRHNGAMVASGGSAGFRQQVTAPSGRAFIPGPVNRQTASPGPVPAAPAVAAGPAVQRQAATTENKADTTRAVSKNVPSGETTVRVDTHRLDEIMNMVGELVLVRNRFETLKAAYQDEQIIKAVANLDVVTSDLQLAVMKTRMQPIKKVFGRFPRLVRDLARNLQKEIQLKLEGEDTDLDKNLVEALADPLIHLVRNAVDHGIELPAERKAAGKNSEGTVILKASQEGDHIQLTIEDDGKGMDAEVLRQKAVEKGLMDPESASRLTEKECYNLIFMPGFSTKTEISDISGRGVGMDVVKTRIIQMNGAVDIDSVKGRGSTIAIKVPLTLAIMPTLMVKLQQQTFALPLTSVVEILDLDLNRINVVDGQTVVVVRNRALPLFYLKDWLIPGGSNGAQPQRGHVVVVNAGGQQVGFVVDHLVGQEEVVIKALGAKLQGLPGLAGATITGDGMIALILDVPGLMKKYAA